MVIQAHFERVATTASAQAFLLSMYTLYKSRVDAQHARARFLTDSAVEPSPGWPVHGIAAGTIRQFSKGAGQVLRRREARFDVW